MSPIAPYTPTKKELASLLELLIILNENSSALFGFISLYFRTLSLRFFKLVLIIWEKEKLKEMNNNKKKSLKI